MIVDSSSKGSIADKKAQLAEAEEEARDYKKRIEFLTQCIEANLMPDSCAALMVKFGKRYAKAMEQQNQTKAELIALEMANTLEQQPEEADKQPGPLEQFSSQAFQSRPLWAVIPIDAEDDVWRRHLGPRKQVSYQLFLTKQHAEEYSSQLRKSRVVPVWGE
jgi:hypothetical protein